jgi:7-alpha-hydroxysteroid dehydrogenase
MEADMGDLTGRVALVTGGGRGVGRAVALAYAEAGADVVVAARTIAQVEDCANEIRARGRRALAVPTDIGDPAQVERLVGGALETFGRIDVLVNNAATAIGVG